MGLFDFLSKTETSARRGHLVNLFAVASADDEIDIKEVDLINKVALRLEMTRPEVEKVMRDPDKINWVPPKDEQDRYHQVYDLVMVMMADNAINDKEYTLCRNFALKAGYPLADVDLILEYTMEKVKEDVQPEKAYEGLKSRLEER